jgi:hypothetical protein
MKLTKRNVIFVWGDYVVAQAEARSVRSKDVINYLVIKKAACAPCTVEGSGALTMLAETPRWAQLHSAAYTVSRLAFYSFFQLHSTLSPVVSKLERHC